MYISGYDEKLPREIQIVLNMGVNSGKETAQWAYPERQEEFFFKHYAHLQELKKRVPSKYEHTLRHFASYLNLKKTLADFYRPSEYLKAPALSPEAFEYIQLRAKEILKDYELFFISLMADHDIGCINDPTKHTIASGELCIADFIRLGFTPRLVDAAKIIIANHSYLGDLMLGEAPFGYYKKALCKKLAACNMEQKGFELLFLLTLIDINSLNIGSMLNNDHFVYQKQILDRSIFEKPVSELMRFRTSRISELIDPNNINPAFHDVYLQYFFDIFNPVNPKNKNLFLRSTKRDGLIAEKFLNQICQLWTKTGGQKKYDYLGFNNGCLEKNDPKLYAIHKELCLESQFYTIDNCVDLANNTFLGFPYRQSQEFLEIIIRLKD
ncbi:MAG: hypothetical protein LBD99_02320 [Candidatus Margulisbacteria bacterium]|jgi:hypothetical protein|nr:hypothetical protein [Candidatus Margulisiibacteriota bacterium]